METKEIAVLVTTIHKGVFFGYTTDDLKSPNIFLRKCQMCLKWSAEIKGVLGLAVVGPNANCRVSLGVDGVVRDITGVWICTKDAIKAWEKNPW